MIALVALVTFGAGLALIAFRTGLALIALIAFVTLGADQRLQPFGQRPGITGIDRQFIGGLTSGTLIALVALVALVTFGAGLALDALLALIAFGAGLALDTLLALIAFRTGRTDQRSKPFRLGTDVAVFHRKIIGRFTVITPLAGNADERR